MLKADTTKHKHSSQASTLCQPSSSSKIDEVHDQTLTALALDEYGFALHKEEFCDALSFRYGP